MNTHKHNQTHGRPPRGLAAAALVALAGAAALGAAGSAAAAAPPGALGALASPAPSPAGEATKDLETIRARLVARELPPAGPAPPSEAEAGRLLAALEADGRWPDIEYASGQRAQWPAGSHVRRALDLARVYRAPGHPLAGKAAVRDRIVLALRWWIANDPQCPNWWWNEIGVPEALGKALLLVGEEFPADLRAGASTILKRAERQDMTGQNTLWVCGVRVMRGCVERSPEVLAAAVRRIADEIKVTTGEGVQPDFSFHQHGALLYSGGYGRGYAVYGPQFALLTSGTGLALAPEKTAVLAGYLLDGEQWMIRGDRFDPSAVGREITRRGHSAAPLAGACDDLVAAGAPRAEELRALAARLRSEKGAPPLLGNRHFWRSDFMVHHRPDWYASVRMFSKRVYNAELVNGEGKTLHHVADGVTLLMRSGHEFEALPPVWDWKRLPGTTCEQGPLPDPVKQRGGTTFVGGASDGLCGAAAMDLKRGALAARRAWFFLDGCMVALGAGVTCASDQPVLTAVEQRPLRGEVTLRDARGTRAAGRGRHALEAARWVRHDGWGWLFPQAAALVLRADAQEGSYRAISDPGSAAPVRADVLSLWLDHGRRPEGGTYAYIVVPGASAEALDAFAAEPPVEVLANTPDLQAVRDKAAGLVAAVFWQPGRAGGAASGPAGGTDAGLARGAASGLAVAADRPCIVLVREQGGGVRAAVANPENGPLAVTLQVNRALAGEGCAAADGRGTAVRFDLPAGPEAGRSVVRDLRAAGGG